MLVLAALAFPAGASAQTCTTDLDYCPDQAVNPTFFTAHTAPKRDRSYPYTFVTTGRLGVPARVGNKRGCDGKVEVRYKVKGTTVSARTAFVHVRNGKCVYDSTVTFAWKRRIQNLGGTPIEYDVYVRFLGNDFVKDKAHKVYSVTGG